MATLSPRDKAAQLVWPQLFGDYAPATSAGWTRVTQLIGQEHVGGFIMSIGSPIETAEKLNACSVSARCHWCSAPTTRPAPACASAAATSFRTTSISAAPRCSRRRWRLGATRDTSLAYQQGRITALEGRALGVHIAFAPVLDVNNNPANPGHRSAIVQRGSAPRRRHGLRADSRLAGTRHDGNGKTLSRPWRHRREFSSHDDHDSCEPSADRHGRAGSVSSRRSLRAFRES